MKKLLELIKRIPADKLLHFIVGLILGSVIMGVNNLWLSILPNGVLTLSIVFLLGLAKEQYDKNHKGTVDFKDVIATVIGGCVGVEIALLLIII